MTYIANCGDLVLHGGLESSLSGWARATNGPGGGRAHGVHLHRQRGAVTAHHRRTALFGARAVARDHRDWYRRRISACAESAISRLRPSTECRMPNAECRMPNAECRMPNAECRM